VAGGNRGDAQPFALALQHHRLESGRGQCLGNLKRVKE
jgi:hypothetical protein